MSIINRKLSKNGFSLIELMVAVAILALAIFGIFQAYSVGFMGMADARDRTVATNYLQQIIEDYKNMYFEEIQNKPMSPITGTKYSQGAIVILEDKEDEYDKIVTLKRVIAQIRWIDRDGDVKTEKASTLIYKKSETSEEGTEGVEIVLYAKSYYTILPESEIALVAEIRDENGNIYNDYSGVIDFSIETDTVVELGTLPPGLPTFETPYILYSVGAINGIAECIFTAKAGDDIEGIERIQAEATVGVKVLTDTVNIRVTTGPVAILLEPPVDAEDNIISYPAEIGGQPVSIGLTIVKADYEEEADSYSGSIDLSVEGPGTLSTDSIDFSGDTTASFTVTSNGTPGVVEITASASDLDMGYTEITFYGEPDSILVKPEKPSVYPGEHLTVTITVVDENIFPVDYSGNLTLSSSPKSGVFDFDPNPCTLSG